MKTKSKISGYTVRSATCAVLFSFALVALTSAFNLHNRSPDLFSRSASLSTAAKPAQQRTPLTFTDRVSYQRAVEEVYWRHRIWPKERPDPKPSLDAVMSQTQLEKKVQDYLRNSQALEHYWQQPITPEQLQAEMDRMAKQTKQPEVLREIFAALGNDPFVIAECLARAALAERLLTTLYAHDQRFHGELKRRAEAELAADHNVKEMKQTCGTYSEMEWVKSEDESSDTVRGQTTDVVATPLRGVGTNVPQARCYSDRQEASNTMTMDGSEWTRSVQKLAAAFGNAKTGRARPQPARSGEGAPGPQHNSEAPDVLAQIKAGVVSGLQEDNDRYYAMEVISKNKDRLKLATIAWMKQPFHSWRAKAETQIPATMAVTTGIEYSLPVISDASTTRTNDTWTATSTTNAPSARRGHTAVWTGSEMIVWGGVDSSYLKTGGRYNPSTDSWTATNITNAPTGREWHTAVWTGTEMVVWGGFFYNAGGTHELNTGGRYSPSTDSWVATSTTNAPSARRNHTALWTGSEMIVWGGIGPFNTGGRYNPDTDSWTPTSTSNAPSARAFHTAVWTGNEMIVWGGGARGNPTGRRYNPRTDSWTATSITNAPSGRRDHTAVWTGSEMIVWGGDYFDGTDFTEFNTGGRYNPSTNSWTPTSTTNAPSERAGHTAVRAGSEMIVWGGFSNNTSFNTGGRYNPSTNSWIATSTTNAPSARESHTAVWTGSGSEMIVWGGSSDSPGTGGRYCALGPPAVTTNPASYVASHSATLNGTVNPRGFATTVYFQYGTTTSYGSTTASHSFSGTTMRSVSANISGLSASTTYHFRVVAHNSAGTNYGADRTFTTLSPTGAPVVTTNPATLIASFSATLNGSLDPHGLTSTVYFQYGTTTSYGLTSAIQSKSGNTYQSVFANISGLTASRTYHFRIVATNSAGTRYGADRTFTTLTATGPPVAITNPATNVASSSATLNGIVDPHGLAASVHFQYGTTTSYGATTPNQAKTGNTYLNVSANIGGLTASTRYHFRIVATNSTGTRYGNDRIFTTQ